MGAFPGSCWPKTLVFICHGFLIYLSVVGVKDPRGYLLLLWSFMCTNLDSKNLLIKSLKQHLQRGIQSLPKGQFQWVEMSDLLAILNNSKNSLKLH
jgi:hypothetical protein